MSATRADVRRAINQAAMTSREMPEAQAQNESLEPITCDLTAIPIEQRPAHVAFVKTLVTGGLGAIRETTNGMRFELPSDRLADVARFIDNERRCCRHLAFALEVPARGAPLTLSVTGPGAREELHALADDQPTKSR